MKLIFTLVILMLWSGYAFTQSPGPLDPLQGGENAATAFVLSGPLPIISTGTTEGYLNDYDETCDYPGSTAPDVVYSYTPPADITVDFDLCGSLYDTKIYIYENTVTPGSPLACNDDYYFSFTCGFYVSKIEGVFLTGGNTYYIVIDGYDQEFGEYTLTINETNLVPCEWGVDLTCPPNSIIESENCDTDENGGCDMIPGTEAWIHVPASGAAFCGTFWAEFGSRDSDWYELVLTVNSSVILTADGDREFHYGMVETTTPGAPECSTLTGDLLPAVNAGPCNESFLDFGTLSPGTYWFSVAMTASEGFPCTNHYRITFEVVPLGCPAPESLLASSITSSSADLGWVETGSATSWEYQVGPLFFTPAATGTLTTNNPVTVNGLTSNTSYDFYVRAVCGAEDTSVWSGPATFTTACTGAAAFPWSESFEANWPPPCWNDPDGDAFGWDQSTYGFEHSGSEWAYCNVAGAALTTADFFLPTDAWLVFYYKAENSASPQDMTVRAGSDVIYQVSGATNEDYHQVNVSLSAYIGQTISISFTAGTGSGGTDPGICLDDVSVRSGFNWTGNTSTSWNDLTNWNIPAVPDLDDIVTIPSVPSGGRFPQVNSAVTAECYNIKIQSGATVTVKTGGSLNVKNP